MYSSIPLWPQLYKTIDPKSIAPYEYCSQIVNGLRRGLCMSVQWGRDASRCFYMCVPKSASMMRRSSMYKCGCVCVHVVALSISPCAGDLHSFCRTGRAVVRLRGAFGTSLGRELKAVLKSHHRIQRDNLPLLHQLSRCTFLTIAPCEVFRVSSQLTLVSSRVLHHMNFQCRRAHLKQITF